MRSVSYEVVTGMERKDCNRERFHLKLYVNMNCCLMKMFLFRLNNVTCKSNLSLVDSAMSYFDKMYLL